MCEGWEASPANEDVFPCICRYLGGWKSCRGSILLQAELMGFAPVPVAMEKVLDGFNTSP